MDEEPLSAVLGSLFGTDTASRNSPAARLLELAARGRATEVDDIHLSSCTTPGTGICATVIALAPLRPHADADLALHAIAAGYDAVTRSATALGGPALLSQGIWPSRAVAPIGGAVTGATLLDLDLATTVEAVSIAAGWQYHAALPEPSRELSYAEAVLFGAVAAISASHGMLGDPAALKDWERFAVRREGDEPLRAGAPTRAVLDTTIKPFCGARQTLSATSALLELVASASLGVADIVRVRVAVPPLHLAMVNRSKIETRLHAISSMQYQVALALLHPDDLYDVQRTPNTSEAMTELMSRVEVRGEPDLLEHFPEQWSAIVEVDTDSETLKLRADGARDELKLNWENLHAKGERLFARADVRGEDLSALQDLLKTFTRVNALHDPAYLACILR
ncbi:MAG TPA: MmgE/PrpD family protein [Acidimicrobiales bacterium]|nr:MmgE/PrpD family protein [Acidimicrobiales bacterium]